jgi:hypothetical protein
MLGWLIISVLSIIGLLFWIIAIKEQEPGLGFLGLIILIIPLTIMGVSYQYHISNIQYRYECYKKVVSDTKALIDSNSYLNMKDMQMGQKLQESIKELRNFEMEVNSCKNSPFSIFKPTLVIDNN